MPHPVTSRRRRAEAKGADSAARDKKAQLGEEVDATPPTPPLQLLVEGLGANKQAPSDGTDNFFITQNDEMIILGDFLTKFGETFASSGTLNKHFHELLMSFAPRNKNLPSLSEVSDAKSTRSIRK